MKKNFFFASFMAFATTLFLAGCSGEDEPNPSPVPWHFSMFVKFESPIGTNAVDSLNFVKLGNTLEDCRMLYDVKNGDIVKARCIRESDGTEIDFSELEDSYNSCWVNLLPFGTPEEGRYDATKDGTLLFLRWAEFLRKISEEESDQAYTIYLKSPKIFGDDEERTIKWYVKVHGNLYNTYRCEVNGVDLEFKGRCYDGFNNGEWLQVSEFVIPMPVNP